MDEAVSSRWDTVNNSNRRAGFEAAFKEAQALGTLWGSPQLTIESLLTEIARSCPAAAGVQAAHPNPALRPANTTRRKS